MARVFPVMLLNQKKLTLREKCPYSDSGLHFPAFRLNMEKCGVSPHIQSECGKMWTRITPNTDTFNAV